MNDWVHCNKCSQKYNPNNAVICFCERCKDSNNNSTCIICNKSVSVVEISKDMDSSVRQFFFPIEEHLKKIFDVYNFQTQNTTRLLRTISQKYEYAKKECISCHKRNKVLTRELRMLKTMLMSMGQNPQPFLTSTPATGSDTLQGDNMSMSSIRFTPNNAGQTIAGYGQRGMSSGDSRHIRTGLGTGPYNYQSNQNSIKNARKALNKQHEFAIKELETVLHRFKEDLIVVPASQETEYVTRIYTFVSVLTNSGAPYESSSCRPSLITSSV
ncbi:hypothetical protein NQ317_012135 [Molorchus minor]|uniref:Uncharacterized protein n=1 Tax=Molorchus minor TaxID=1323400 RepID=A0ABQ9K5F1_9CUCU|nr:hypothetical protein NQ317_012135 [Molorchus minor]